MNQYWRTKDVILANGSVTTDPLLYKPFKTLYLTRQGPVGPRVPNPPNPDISSQHLFLLGLALTELACLQPIEKLRLPEDIKEDANKTSHATASRLLSVIKARYGDTFAEVVGCCLSWSGHNGEDMDDEEFQNAVYDKIVQPLKSNLYAGDAIRG